MATAKEELKALLEAQPEDSSPEEIVRELALHIMVRRGMADSDAGRTISNEDMLRRIRSWQTQPGPKRLRAGSRTSSSTSLGKIRTRRLER